MARPWTEDDWLDALFIGAGGVLLTIVVAVLLLGIAALGLALLV